MRRYQRRNAISPISDEAIILRTFSYSSSYQQTTFILSQGNQLVSSISSNLIKNRLNLDGASNKTKNSCAAPAA